MAFVAKKGQEVDEGKMRLSHHFFFCLYYNSTLTLYKEMAIVCVVLVDQQTIGSVCQVQTFALIIPLSPFQVLFRIYHLRFSLFERSEFWSFPTSFFGGAGWPAILCLMHFCSVVSVENDSNDLSNPKRDNLFAALLKLHYTVSALAAHC